MPPSGNGNLINKCVGRPNANLVDNVVMTASNILDGIATRAGLQEVKRRDKTGRKS